MSFSALSIFLLTTPLYASSIFEPIFRSGEAPFALSKLIFGTNLAPFGGVGIPIDVNAVRPFARAPFLRPGRVTPSRNAFCREWFQSNPLLRRRWEQKHGPETRVEAAADDLSTWTGWMHAPKEQPEPFSKRIAPFLPRRLSAVAAPDAISMVSRPEVLADLSPEELDCLYYLGYAPQNVPLGPAYGRLLNLLGQPIMADVSSSLWGGKIFLKTQCDREGRELTLAVNHVARSPEAWAQLYVSRYPQRTALGFAAGEDDPDDTEASLWVDYGAPLELVCPALVPRDYDERRKAIDSMHLEDILKPKSIPVPQVQYGSLGPFTSSFRAPQASVGIFDNAWPVRDAIDALRWVGRDEEFKTDIYLGKAYYIFNDGLRPVAWFTLKIADAE